MTVYNNLLDVLAKAVRESPTQLAFKFLADDNVHTLTYQELDTKAKALATLLQKHPCRGERAMLLLPPGLDYIIAFFGCLYAGLIPIPAYPPRRNHHAQRLAAITNNAQAQFILTHQVFVEQCHLAPYIITVDEIDKELATQYQPIEIKSESIAFFQYTSGSTSEPKGVMISHQNILTNLAIIQSYFGDKSERICSWLPPYHDMGLIGGILYPIFVRQLTYLMPPAYFLQSPWRWLELISREKITTCVAPNFAYDLCVKKVLPEQIYQLDLSCWQYALNGAEPIRYETIENFCEMFKAAGLSPHTIRPVYGLAEGTLIVTAAEHRTWNKPLIISKSKLEKNKNLLESSSSDNDMVKLISCGKKSFNHDIKIVDTKTLLPLSEGEVGEIWVSGPSVAIGYWNNPQLTQQTLKAKLKDSSFEYLRTGDLGFFAEEELYITGRVKDLIIQQGLNHYPQDIEQTVMESHPALQLHGTAAFTIEKNGEEQLVLAQEIARTALNKLNKDAIFNSISSKVLAEHGLQVKYICLVKPHTLPKTSSGKIQRWVCKQHFLSHAFSCIAEWNYSKDNKEETQKKWNVENWLINWINQRIPLTQQIKHHDSLVQYGFDSLMAVELAADLQILGKKIDPTSIIEQKTVSELIQFLTNTEERSSYTKKETQYLPLIKSSPHPLGKAIKDIYFATTEGISRDTTIINNQQLINYAGYNYLGMSGDPFITEAVIKAVKEYGTSVSASRIASGQKHIHGKLERAIADLIGVEDCLVYSSGHATNISVISHLFGPNDLILHDALCHNSILQGIIFSGATRVAFPHNDYNSLQNQLEKLRSYHARALIISEGIFSMDGDIPDVHKLVSLKEKYSAFIMLDEAHSIGTLGKTGGGVREHFNLKPNDIDIWMGTLSKALASCGGYIAGSADLIENLKYYAAGFIYSAGISPANTAAALAAIELLLKEPKRIATLHSNHHLLLNLLNKAGICTGNSYNTPIIPIITGGEIEAINLSLALKTKGIYTIPIFYPAVEKGKARVRLFVNSLHNEKQLYYTAETIQNALLTLAVKA